MSHAKLVLVAGATGTQGGSVADALFTRGHRVRALTRNPDSPAAKRLRARGAEIAVGDMTDHGTLARAAQGVDAVYAMTTPFEQGVEHETAQGRVLTDAAAAAEVPHLVFSSVASADRATGIPHFESKFLVEEHIRTSGIPYTIVAPVYFMENLLLPWGLPALREGRLAMAMPGDRPLQQVSVADIGAFVAAVVERGEAVHGRRYDFAGDAPTGDRAAAILSEVSGRPIRYESFPPDALRQQSEDLALMYAWFDAVGYSADLTALRRDFPEVGWHDYQSWAREQDWSVLDADQPHP